MVVENYPHSMTDDEYKSIFLYSKVRDKYIFIKIIFLINIMNYDNYYYLDNYKNI